MQKPVESFKRHLRKPSSGNKKQLASWHHKIKTESTSPMTTLQPIAALPEHPKRRKDGIPGGEWEPYIRGVMEQPGQAMLVQDGLTKSKASAGAKALRRVKGMKTGYVSDQALLDTYGMDLQACAVFAQYDKPQESA